MRIIDITATIAPDMVVYKNIDKNRPVQEVTRQMPEDSANETALWLAMHTGTHFDAPRHMMPDGGLIMESLPLEKLITRCRVFDLTHLQDGITQADLEPFGIKKGEFIILKTRNSAEDFFNPEYIYVKEDGARYLAQVGINGVGIDSLGIERAQPNHETHITLFQHNIIILEGLRLAEVEAGEYILIALPLKIRNAEGSPTRAVLIEGELTL
ncbi:MAG: cyclase family protein [Ruminococcaceae bacterium]|nr:cyclase family protein [Oscillospiraceae bacterium]